MDSGEAVRDGLRRLVRVLPPDYLRDYGEDLVSTLADAVDETGVLPLRERLAVWWLAVRLRLVTPVSTAAGAALLMALVAVHAGGALARVAWALGFGLVVPDDVPLSADLPAVWRRMVVEDIGFGIAWGLVLVGLWRGWRYAAGAAAVLAVVPLLVSVLMSGFFPTAPGLLRLATGVVALAAGRSRLAVPGTPWAWGAAVIGAAAAYALTAFNGLYPGYNLPWWLVWGVAAVALGVAAWLPRWALLAGTWAGALTSVVFGLAAVTAYGPPAWQEALAGLVVALVLGALAWNGRMLRV